ncbi:MAG: tetratricopeptide (TPR) repeat protein [Planctomycetota bacterium]
MNILRELHLFALWGLSAAAVSLGALTPLAQSSAVQQDAGAQPDAAAKQAQPQVLTPAQLPQAAPGTWDGFFDPAGFSERVAALDRTAMAALEEGEAAYRKADFPLAVASLNRALVASPDLPPAWLVLGTTYFRMQRYSDGRDSYERFLGVAPGESWRTQGLAHCYYSLGSYGTALAHYELVLERVPKSSAARQGLALAHWRLGHELEALEHITALAEDESERFEAQLWCGRMLFETGSTEAAISKAWLATRLGNHDPRAWFLVLECLWELGEEEEAGRVEFIWRERDAVAQERRGLQADLRLDPYNWAKLRRLVELAQSVGDSDAAMKLLPRVLKDRPADVTELSARLFALDVLVQLSELEAARAVARGIERGCSEDLLAWRALEEFYGRIGDNVGLARAGEQRRRLGGK